MGIRCSQCGADAVLSYATEATALCPACCGKVADHGDGENGHQYEYERSERHYFCRYCGEPASDQWVAERFDPEDVW